MTKLSLKNSEQSLPNATTDCEADGENETSSNCSKTTLPTWEVFRYEIYLKPETEKIDRTELVQQFANFRPGVHYQSTHKHVHSVVVSTSEKQEFLFIKLSPETDAIQENLDDDNDADNIPSAFHYILPSQNFIGLWESLLYDDESLK